MEELLAVIVQFLFEIFGEFIFQVVIQFMVELFVRLVTSLFGSNPTAVTPETATTPKRDLRPAIAFEERAHPAAIFVLYAVLGGVIGYISLLVRPEHFIRIVSHRWLNLLITPLFSGGAMAALGSWHNKRGDRVVGMDKFFNGWGFALAFAIVRLVACR